MEYQSLPSMLLLLLLLPGLQRFQGKVAEAICRSRNYSGEFVLTDCRETCDSDSVVLKEMSPRGPLMDPSERASHVNIREARSGSSCNRDWAYLASNIVVKPVNGGKRKTLLCLH